MAGHEGKMQFDDGVIRISIDGLPIKHCVGYAVDHTPQGQPILVLRVLLKSLNAPPRLVVPVGPVSP